MPEVPGETTTTNTSFCDGSLQGWGPDTFYTKYVVTVFDYKDDITWTTGHHSFNFGGQYRREWDNGTGVTSTGQSGNMSSLLTRRSPWPSLRTTEATSPCP